MHHRSGDSIEKDWSKFVTLDHSREIDEIAVRVVDHLYDAWGLREQIAYATGENLSVDAVLAEFGDDACSKCALAAESWRERLDLRFFYNLTHHASPPASPSPYSPRTA